jgi:hypothetical protein
LPTATLPASEAEPFFFDLAAEDTDPASTATPPAVYFVAPRYTYSNGRIAAAL